MPTQPLVTVVIPAYEAGETVLETIDSVLAQTHRELEVLVYDDGSRRSPVPDQLPQDPRLVVERLEHNGGYAVVTNLAAERATGEWVTFVDADDTVQPRYVETLLEAARATEADVVLTPLMQVRDGKEIGWAGWDAPDAVAEPRTAARSLLLGTVPGSQHSLLRSPSPMAVPGQAYSDWLYVFQHVAAAHKVAFLDESHYRYRIHSDSVTGSLRESIWDLAQLDELVAPVVDELFTPQEAEQLKAAHRRYTVTQMLHKAAGEAEPSALRDEVAAWCRRRITPAGIRTMWRGGQRAAAASWLLAKVCPPLHRMAYRRYEARKTHGADRDG